MSGTVDIATLGLEVKSTGVDEATANLGKLEQTAVKTEAASLKMSDAMAKAVAAVTGMSAAAIKSAASTGSATAKTAEAATAATSLAQETDKVSEATKRSEAATKQAQKANEGLGSSWKTLVAWAEKLAVAIGVYKLGELIKDTILLAARFDTLGVVIGIVGNNAGYSTAQMAEFQAGLEATNISAIEARQSLARMGEGQIDFAHSVELANVAKNAAVIANTNSSEAFSRMITGIATGQSIILHHMGLMTNFEQAYIKTANALGKTTNELTETEKSEARVNEVLKAGVAIAGVYDAAMGTVGKQLNSLKRYTDNLKVAWGEVFQDSLLVGTKSLTDGLKEANAETEKLAQADKLKEWGRSMVVTFAAVADGVSGVVKTIQTITVTVLSGIIQLYDVAVAAKRLASGDFAGAGQAMQDRSNEGRAYVEQMNSIWNTKSFQQDASDMYAFRDSTSSTDKALADQAEKQRIAAAEKMKAEREKAEQQEVLEKKFLASIKDSIAQVKSYDNALKSLGDEKLRFAGEEFSDTLKKEAQLLAEHKIKVEDILTPLLKYNSIAQEVFTEREAITREGLDKVAELYNKFNATVFKNISTKDAQKDALNILVEYKAIATQMIGVEQDRYKVLLEGERKYANEITTLMKAKKQELVELQKYFLDSSKTFHEKMATTLGGSYLLGKNAYLDPNANAYDKRNSQIEMLRSREAAADAIEDPKLKLEKLKDVYERWGQMTDAVIVDGAVILTQEDAFKEALSERERMEKKITDAVKQQQDELQAAYAASEARVDSYKSKLQELDNILKNMTSKIDLTLKIHGYEQITAIQQFLIDARNNPIIGVAQGANPSGGGYTVTNNPNQAISGFTGSNVTVAGDINVTMPNVTNVSSQTADEMARAITPALQEYQNRVIGD